MLGIRGVLGAACLLVVCLASAGATTLDQIASATVAINCRVEGTPGGFIGTGVVVHGSGYVLTSTTVVPPKAVDIRCHFLGALNRPARLVVADEKLELAIIKVEPPGDAPLTTITLGDSKAVAVGQTVFTVGDGYSTFLRSGRFTTSLGILSGIYELTKQTAPQPVYVGRVLETTATVAPGMDGGPLLDGAGRLIGLLSLNVSDARWMGVAVPIDALQDRLAEEIANDAKEHLGKGPDQMKLRFARDRGEPLFAAQEKQDSRFREAAQRVAASVVALEVDRKSEPRPTTQPASRPARPVPRPRPRPQGAYKDYFVRPKALVSGLVVSSEGHILTSHYNVWGELNSIHVVLPDGRRLAAKLLGHDEAKDLALLKVDAKDLTPVVWSVDPPALTAPVAAIGRSPDPASFTITRGIISAVGRLNGTALQIDAETNYANAGGPVIDSAGRVVGLVTFVRPDAIWGQNSGIGFATSSASVRQVLSALRGGQVVAKPKRGFLGIVMSGGHVDQVGAVIEQVQDDGPADQAGLKPKDVITHIDGKPVADPADVGNLILKRRPGEVVKLTIKRGQQVLTVEVTLGEHPYQ